MRALALGAPARRQSLPRTLRLHFQIAHARLQFQQLQLRVTEFFAARAVLLDALQPQPLFQYLDLQICPMKLSLQLGYGGRVVGGRLRGIGDRDRQKQL